MHTKLIKLFYVFGFSLAFDSKIFIIPIKYKNYEKTEKYTKYCN